MYIFDEKMDFKLSSTAVTLGKFDGFHLGHQTLVREVLHKGEENGCETVLFSFDTAAVNGQKVITVKEERILLCKEFGLQHVIFYPVNRETMSIEPEDFIKQVLVDRLGVKYVVTGEDFRFGRQRRGDVAMLQRYADIYGYRLVVVGYVSVEGKKVSSTTIKEYLAEGRIEKVNEMLGYSYFLMGEVAEGNQIGRKMEVKTLNLIPSQTKSLPPNGVYKTQAVIDGVTYRGITNIGYSPTIRSDGKITVETHLFDFAQDIYGKTVKVQFEKFIRKEQKFEDIDALKRQIILDISQANL